jgi:DNA-binding CsgD family transcriptional regulator
LKPAAAQLKLLAEGKNQRAVGDAVGISIKGVQYSLAVMRRYAGVTTTSELVRVVVDQLGGLI